MSDLRELIMEAGSAALIVDGAKSALDDAKARVEFAKTNLNEANSAFEEILAKCEEHGLQKNKVKKAVEDINLALIAVGVVSEPETDFVKNTVPIVPDKRKRKGKFEDKPVEATATIETSPAVPVEAIVEVKTDVEDVAAPVLEDGEEFSTEYYDIKELIAECTSIPNGEKNEESVANAVLVLNDVLKLAQKTATAEADYFDHEYFIHFLLGLRNDNSLDSETGYVYERFVAVIHSQEAGKVTPLFPVDVVDPDEIENVNTIATGSYIDTNIDVETTLSAEDLADLDDLEHDIEEHQSFDGYSNNEVMVSDDETFPISGEPEDYSDDGVQVLDNLEGVNFLNNEEKAEIEKPKEETRRRFSLTPPPFLNKS